MLFNNFNDYKELEDSFLGILDFYHEQIEERMINEIKMQMKASFRKEMLYLLTKEVNRGGK